MTPRQRLARAILLALFILGCDRVPEIIQPVRVDTVVVHLPGHVDTLIVPRVDTTYVAKPETTVVQLPGRVDTLIVQHVDTVTVRRVDTLLVVTHDTVVVHDTVRRVDTVRLSREPVYVCLSIQQHDTLYALNAKDTPYCDAAHLAPQFPTATVYVNVDSLILRLPAPAPTSYRGTLLLPGYLRSGR